MDDAAKIDRVARAICEAMNLDCTRERGDCALCGGAAEAAIKELTDMEKPGMMGKLDWRSLHGWEPTEGTWAVLWPGYYGPFTACWIDGRWTICEDADFSNAIVGAELTIPHLATDQIPTFDREVLRIKAGKKSPAAAIAAMEARHDR